MHDRNRPSAHLRSNGPLRALRRTPLAVAVSGLLASTAMPVIAFAQDEPVIEEIIVTALRREQNIQDIPINITAFDANLLERREIGDLAELGRNVPGLYVLDQGKRSANNIVVRGLNLNAVKASDFLANNGGAVVSTYVGDIPLYVDLGLNDINRVEVLLGPQGTLYGAGTLGGAIRYIPKRPEFGKSDIELRGSTFGLAESDSLGYRMGVTGNVPLTDNLAMRINVDYYEDPGFIDNPFLVNEPGVSDPEPNLSDPAAVAANLHRRNDANWEHTWTGRVGLRWQPTSGIDANLTYYYQDMNVGGRTQNNVQSFGTGNYEASTRFLEPNDRKNHLAALEINADLGFATLTSATGYATYQDYGHRDQTDLLITLEYSYEAFPSFSAFTTDQEKDRNVSQELRLVSKGAGPWNWIGGVFYFTQYSPKYSKEFTPHYDEFLGGELRPDSLEYYAIENDDLTENAVFGEVGYELTDKWQITVGTRYYDYKLLIDSGAATPLLNTAFFGLPPNETGLTLERNSQSDSGWLYKFNTSYRFTDDLMGYFTLSEGYRIGASNGVAPCDNPPSPNQNVCALPDELQYFPDKTTNYEIGIRSEWLDRRLTFNGSLYYIDWSDPQLETQTVHGAQPITKNGSGARSTGVEFSLDARVTDRISLAFGYSHTNAELSEDAPGLLRVYTPPGFNNNPQIVNYTTALAGDRLPGSPQDQGTAEFNYRMPLSGGRGIDFNYGIAAIGDVITNIGNRADGETFGGYAVHSASAVWRSGQWNVGLYATNLLNKYAVTGRRSREQFVQTVADANGDPVHVRAYAHEILRPREVGLKFTYSVGPRPTN
jgi:iron complex outermembrane receptor protein